MEHLTKPFLKVVTLNCWGIPIPYFGSKDRGIRFQAIGRELCNGGYDIVLLQEVWSLFDFETVRQLAFETLPFSHYFHSGLIGAGICVLSRFPIVESLFHRFHLNGFPHKIQHGDWFGGKGVGLCHIQHPQMKVFVYTTHVHAEYDRDNDEYLAHRVAQAFEMSQFVRHTSYPADVVVCAGDFNFEPSDAGYDIIRHNAGLLDAWEEQRNKPADVLGMTCACPTNCYVLPCELARDPLGKRIDYVLFRGCVRCTRCYTAMGKIPDATEDMNFSDHEAVVAEFDISFTELSNPTVSSKACLANSPECIASIERGLPLVKKGIEEVPAHRNYFFLLSLVYAVCWFIFEDYVHAITFFPIGMLYQFITVLLCFTSLVMGIVIKPAELHGLVNCMEEMEIKLSAAAGTGGGGRAGNGGGGRQRSKDD